MKRLQDMEMFAEVAARGSFSLASRRAGAATVHAVAQAGGA
ncbi:hypothetical protein WJ970_31505 [Achromobacter xylosoxidans]